MIVGGMPEAVANFIAKPDDLERIRTIQKGIIDAYILDFAKHAPANQLMKISAIFEKVPSELAKENKKFHLSSINDNARVREYEEAIQWLMDAGLILKSQRVSNPKLPLRGYADPKAFKLFLLDVGLTGAMSNLPPKLILQKNELFTEFKGAFTENFVAQTLAPLLDHRLYYWASEGRAEVDFILPINSQIFPLEVKSGESKRKKSLLVYQQKFHPQSILRTSPMNFDQQGDFINIPLYALWSALNKIKELE
jgi:predicted AAA+ superfamily ATPase